MELNPWLCSPLTPQPFLSSFFILSCGVEACKNDMEAVSTANTEEAATATPKTLLPILSFMICRPFHLWKHSSFHHSKTCNRDDLLSWEQLWTAGEVYSDDWQQIIQLSLVLFSFCHLVVTGNLGSSKRNFQFRVPMIWYSLTAAGLPLLCKSIIYDLA